MSVSEKRLIPQLILTAALFIASAVSAVAAEERSPLHWSGDKTLFDRDSNKVELVGNAAVHQLKESLFADRITLELDTKIVHAIGNATFVSSSSMIQASEMHFNLETRTGTIVGGRVSTPTFTLTGERINKLGTNRFQTHRGEYTTCKDCPQSWVLSAEDVDLELDGYAHLSNVTVKIMDAPAVWFPYLIVPIKTRRQTGFLIPKLGFATRGFTFVQPFFWAITPSADMTFGFGTYGGRGRRIEWEGRYALNDGKGTANFWHLNDRAFKDYLGRSDVNLLNREGYSSMRWALSAEQNQTLPFGIEQKLRLLEVSDNLYRNQVGDIPGVSDAFLTSDLSFTHTTDKVSVFVAAKRYRNLLSLVEPTVADPREFDPTTVQVFPQVMVSANDKLFFDGKLGGGLSLGVMNFVRSAGPFDVDQTTPLASGAPYRRGQDPLREATRVSFNPSLYTTVRAWDVASIVPTLQYKNYFYNFKGEAPSLSRGYVQFKTDFSTQLERVYLTSDPETPKTKHWIRPKLTYSLIPYRREPDHPFTRQMEFAKQNNFSGYNFDNEDITPIDASPSTSNYFAPVGHSVTYGFTTQLVRKRVPKTITELPTYQRAVEWTTAQTYNIRELNKNASEQRPLSRFVSLLTFNFDRFTSYFDYYYTPYQPMDEETSRHVYSTGMNYTFAKGVNQRILLYERSLGLNYAFNKSSLQSQTQNITTNAVWSISDFVMPSIKVTYDVLKSRWMELDSALVFQSPSECWKLDLGFNQQLCPVKEGSDDSTLCSAFRFNLSINLTGSGFGSISETPGGSGG